MQAKAEGLKLCPLPPGAALRLLWSRLPKRTGLWPGRPRRLASLMAFGEETVRARLRAQVPAGELEYQVRSAEASSGDHYLVPLYRWGRKVAEAWVPAATVRLRGEASLPPAFFRVFPEARPLAGPRALLREHKGLNIPADPRPKLYWLASRRFSPAPFFGWEGEEGLWLLEARRPSRLAFRAVFLAETEAPSDYRYRGKPVHLAPLPPHSRW